MADEPHNHLGPIIELTAEIVSAYVSKNPVPVSSLPDLIESVNLSLMRIDQPPPPEVPTQAPAVNPKRSVTPDFIICLEDGKKFKSLKRHLSAQFGLTPDEYRQKWGLPSDYPMVAPNYSESRSNMAKSIGLGRKPTPPPTPPPAPAPAPAKKVAAKRAKAR